MDDQLERIDAKMAKLAEQKKKIKDKTSQAITSIVLKNKNDMILLAGMILDSDNIVKKNKDKVEIWREAGRNFLKKGKSRKSDPKGKEDTTSNQLDVG